MTTATSGERRIWRWLRLTTGLTLMGWLLIQADPAQVAETLARAHISWIAAAVGLVLLDRGLMAYRWLLLLRVTERGRTLSLGPVMRVFFVSTFLGTFLPASVGGDAIRTVGLSRLQVPVADAFASVVVDRLSGVISVLLMAAAALVVIREAIDPWAFATLALTIGTTVGVAVLLLFDARVLTGLVRWATSHRFARVEQIALRALASIRHYGQQRDVLAAVLTASAVVQTLRTLQAWCLGSALGLTTGLAWYFAFVPIIILLMTLPISVAGIGTSQLGFQVLFGLAGVARADAWALSVLFLALGVVGNLPGGWLFMFSPASTGRPRQ